MSSRNAYLTAAQRPAALSLSQGLAIARNLVRRGERNAGAITLAVRERIAKHPQTRVDYVAVVDPESLDDVAEIGDRAVLAVAAFVGETRLIDNCILNAAE
jgi:pantoate--beta-alanine ligase